MRLAHLVHWGITAQLAVGSTAQRIITPSFINVYCFGSALKWFER